MSLLISLKNTTKKYNKKMLFSPVSLDINKGDFVTIVGPSGTGKTTLLRILCGIENEFEGDVLIRGKSIQTFSEKQKSELRATMMGVGFQFFHLFENCSLLQNVMLPALFHPDYKKWSEDQMLKRAHEVLLLVGISDHAQKSVNHISGGQLQRVALARAIFCDPPVLILDEPTSFLDDKTQTDIFKFLKEQHKAVKTIIMATHASAIEKYSDKHLILEK